MNKSIKLNMILNALKNFFAIIFPLITFPYASQVLKVENMGKISFSNSIVGYFVLLAGLGISSYSIREGAKYRDTEELDKFASEVFSINIISSVISYFLLIFVVILTPKLNTYKYLILIQSLSILFTTLGADWINSIFEDFCYITLSTILFQFISLLLLFLFVRQESDYYIYAFISVFSSIGYNVFSMFHIRKYVNLKFTISLNLKRHLKPIMIIFSTAITTTIYVNSDMTILGFITNDYYTGIYSVSVKIYNIIKQLLQAIVIVTLPRLSYFYSNSIKTNFNTLLKKVFSFIILLSIPICVGTILLANDIIMIIAGSGYLEAMHSLKILGVALVFSSFATVVTTSILLPQGKEEYVFKASIFSSIVNVVLNIFLIPIMKSTGAAITTLIAELLMMILGFYFSGLRLREYVDFNDIACSMLECLAIVVNYTICTKISNLCILKLGLCLVLSGVSYFLILFILKNKLLIDIVTEVKAKLKRV